MAIGRTDMESSKQEVDVKSAYYLQLDICIRIYKPLHITGTSHSYAYEMFIL